jgi:GTP cyclohydrolase I
MRPEIHKEFQMDPGRQFLTDVQGSRDVRGVAIQQVGVKEVMVPIQLLQKNGRVQSVSANCRLSVGLSPEFKGTHLSRFVIQLSEWSRGKVLSLNFREFLAETIERLEVESAQTEIRFRYFVDKKAPVSGLSAPMAYECTFEGDYSRSGDGREETYQLVLGLAVPIATLCPCSKAISKYGAHNQRAEIRVRVRIDSESDHRIVWIEDLVKALEECGSCQVYPLVKREDEKFMTEQAYENPRFVEDVIREVILLLRDYPGICGFSVAVEAMESIHGHNAWACHAENL